MDIDVTRAKPSPDQPAASAVESLRPAVTRKKAATRPAGQDAPETAGGELGAHEMGHIAQQKQAPEINERCGSGKSQDGRDSTRWRGTDRTPRISSGAAADPAGARRGNRV